MFTHNYLRWLYERHKWTKRRLKFPSRGLWFTLCPIHDLVHYLTSSTCLTLVQIDMWAVWACGIPLVTLWYLSARAWSDEKRQISYSVACAGKGWVERQILRTARGREACQLHTRHQTAASGSPWQITRVWSSRGTVPARWLMFEGKSTLAVSCTRMHTQTAVEMDWIPLIWWHIHCVVFNPLLQPRMKTSPPSFH